jgi:catechol 2,3-dioxygenase
MHFYNKVCGVEEVRRETGIRAGFLSNGNTHHDIAAMEAGCFNRVGVGGHVQISEERGQTPGLNHLAWEVDNEADVAAAWSRAVKSGVGIHVTENHQIAHSVYLFDPDGNMHEFYADVVEDWRAIFNPTRDDLVTSSWDPATPNPLKRAYWNPNPSIRRVDDAAFHPRCTRRAVMVANDFRKMQAFCVDVAGLVSVEGGNDEFVLYRGSATDDGWDLALFAPAEGLEPGLHRTIMEVPDEADLISGEKRVGGAKADLELIIDQPHKRSAFVRDPDGLLFEFRYQRGGAVRLPSNLPPALRIYYL